MHTDPPNGCALAEDDAQDGDTRARAAEAHQRPSWPPAAPPGPIGEWRGASMRGMRSMRTPRRGRHWLAWVAGGCLLMVGLAVLACALVIGALAGLAIHFANFREAQMTMTRTLAVAGMPRIVVDGQAGDVIVVAGPAGTVTVEATRRARAESADIASHAAQNISVDIQQSGATVTVRARGGGDTGVGRSSAVDLTITVPARSNVDLHADTGNVSVSDVAGMVSITVGVGDARLAGVTLAGASSVDVGTGDVMLGGRLASGAALRVSVDTGDVDVTLPLAAAVTIDAATGLGEVHVPSWPVPVARDGAGASARGETAPNPNGMLTIRVDTGDIGVSAG
jgi:hypothetical protein